MLEKTVEVNNMGLLYKTYILYMNNHGTCWSMAAVYGCAEVFYFVSCVGMLLVSVHKNALVNPKAHIMSKSNIALIVATHFICQWFKCVMH